MCVGVGVWNQAPPHRRAVVRAGGGYGGRCSVVVAMPGLNLSSGSRLGRIFAAVHQTIPTIRRKSATGHARRP